MISTGCRDVQHTGLQSTQSRRNYRATTLVSKVHKQGASLNSQGVQHNYRLAKNTKKKELGTAHHNDASSTGYLITITLHQ